ncbi:MAG: hypothetical protein ABI977_26880 [Acidobacteriota bacterium]
MVICPSCGSSRIRNGYKPAPLWLRLIGVRGLLCDGCNFPFRAFSPLPPKSRRPHHVQRKADVFNPAPMVDLTQIRPKPPVEKPGSQAIHPQVEKPELKVAAPSTEKFELKAVPSPVEKFNFAASSSPTTSAARIVTDHIAPARNDLRTEVTRIHGRGARKIVGVPAPLPAQSEPNPKSQNCPECNSRNIKRRHRNFLERTLLAPSEHKAYTCRNCGASFYAKSEEREARAASSNPANGASIESSCFNVEQKG